MRLPCFGGESKSLFCARDRDRKGRNPAIGIRSRCAALRVIEPGAAKKNAPKHNTLKATRSCLSAPIGEATSGKIFISALSAKVVEAPAKKLETLAMAANRGAIKPGE